MRQSENTTMQEIELSAGIIEYEDTGGSGPVIVLFSGAAEVTPTDAKAYRDHLLAKRYTPTMINRALINLMLFFNTIGSMNPFRNLTMIEIVEPAPVALSRTEQPGSELQLPSPVRHPQPPYGGVSIHDGYPSLGID